MTKDGFFLRIGKRVDRVSAFIKVSEVDPIIQDIFDCGSGGSSGADFKKQPRESRFALCSESLA